MESAERTWQREDARVLKILYPPVVSDDDLNDLFLKVVGAAGG